MIPNVLAERYATEAMRGIWSPRGRIILERELWIAILKAQADLGLPIPEGAMAAYERAADEVDLDDIMQRERRTRHDVKARIDAFCELAGHEHIHKGMTSRDLTENVEQLQVIRSLKLVAQHAVAALSALARRAREYRDQLLVARTHNVPAQPTTLGKRLSMFGEEFLRAIEALEHHLATYPVRGLKGAVGTQLDQLSLFGGDPSMVKALEERLLTHLGIGAVWVNTGQVYPRSLDQATVAALDRLAAAPSSFARTLRLMAGQGTAGEGFAEGQTGSSAMPHKMNARSCERINGLRTILHGHLAMASSLAGDQWNEGDVSCSVVRRVFLPDAFFAMDGQLETFHTVLLQMEAYPALLDAELERDLPFVLSTTILMAAVKAGAGREEAHEAIKEHAVAAMAARRGGAAGDAGLLEALAGDPRLGLTRKDLEGILDQGRERTGAAADQVDAFLKESEKLVARFPGASDYRPAAIL